MSKLIMPEKDTGIPRNIPVVLVTPELAKEWLDTRFENERPVHKNKVRAYARDMEEGNWHFTADTIRFDDATGKLLDGQHRLLSVAESGLSQWFPIVNIPKEAKAGIDTGSKRSLGELLHMGNHVNGRVVAAIVRRVLIYRDGVQGSSGGRYLPTHTEGVQFANENEKALREAAEVAMRFYRASLPAAPSSVGAAYFLCAKVDKEQADDMFNRIITGLNMTEGDPVMAYRNRMTKHEKRNRVNLPPDDTFRFAIMAWNHLRRGNSISRLQVPREGWSQTNVPVPE